VGLSELGNPLFCVQQHRVRGKNLVKDDRKNDLFAGLKTDREQCPEKPDQRYLTKDVLNQRNCFLWQ
jgi:hypothetical protein